MKLNFFQERSPGPALSFGFDVYVGSDRALLPPERLFERERRSHRKVRSTKQFVDRNPAPHVVP